MKELHPSEVFDRIVDFVAAKLATYTLLITAVAIGSYAAISPPKNKPILAGGACGVALIGKVAKDWERSKKLVIGDIREASLQGRKAWLQSLMLPSSLLSISVDISNWTPPNLVTDIGKLLQSKHARILGDTGSGKSILAKYLARTINGEVKVYDVEATKKDWRGFEVVGKGENWQAITNAMKDDLSLISERVGIATSDDNDDGWDALTSGTTIRIVEEYPDVKDEVNKLAKGITNPADGLADEWCSRGARRGRKPGLFLILISQFDAVSAWGFEGKSALVKCFRAIRLGEFAIAHAKSLKDKQLEAWLKQDLTSRCMVDDQPCQLPTREMMLAIGSGVSLPPSTPQSAALPPASTTALNEYEQAILSWGKAHPGKALKARELQQSNRLFDSVTPEDIRLWFQSLADRKLGQCLGEGNRLGWVWSEEEDS